MNLSTSTINSLAKYFFPFCQQLNFIFLLLPSKSIFHFFPPSLTGDACWCACCAVKSVRANTGMCLIFSFACVAQDSATSFSVVLCVLVCCEFLLRRAARKKKTFGERECLKKYCSGISFYKT